MFAPASAAEAKAAHLAKAIEGSFAPPDLFWFASYPAAVDGLTADQAACCGAGTGAALRRDERLCIHPGPPGP